MADKSKASAGTQGRFVWHELHTNNEAGAKGFYGELFNWTTSVMEGSGGAYTLFSANGVPIGGFTKPQGKSPEGWLSYCSVHDVDAAVERAKKLGATVELPPTDYPSVGRFATVVDKQGARIAPFKMESESPDLGAKPALGTFCWNELVTQDPTAALALYREVFGWSEEAKDMGPMGAYHVMKRSDKQAGGIMKAMDPRAPSAWLGYVVVDDVDRSFEQAKRLKGSAIVPPTDIPGMGRFAVLADPAGGTIGLFK